MELLSAIGYPVADIDAYQALAERVFDRGTGHKAGENFYLQYHDPSGAELWLQVDLRSAFVGMNPFYVPRRATRLALQKPVLRLEGTMDGAFEAILPETGQVLTFDMPDAHLLPPIKLPVTTDVLLSGFLVSTLAVGSADAAAIANAGKPDDPARHTLIGQVRETALRHNQHSGQEFRWMLLQLPGMEIELVGSLSDTPLGLLHPGAWVQATCWLAGRVQVSPDAQAPTGFLERVFWGG
jgi:hypothetical protein